MSKVMKALLLVAAAGLVVALFGGRRFFAAACAKLSTEKRPSLESEFDEFTTYYYRSPNPSKAPRMLGYYLVNSRDLLKANPAQATLMGYTFGRIAHGDAQVLREYERLLPKASSEGRLVITLALALPENREFLRARLNDPEFNAVRDMVVKLLGAGLPGPQEVLVQPINSGTDLDLLWSEFLVTGNTRAVSRIIDVLEWPDRVRGRLQSRMDSGSVTAQQAQILEQAGIVLDLQHNEIVNVDDLDVACVLKEGIKSPGRFAQVRQALPFTLSEEDVNHLAVKSAAWWSLASNAQQHPLALQTCEVEAAKRTGRGRLALLEIVARTYVSRGAAGWQAAFTNYELYRQLKYDLQTPQLAKAKTELRDLRGLSATTAIPVPGEVSDLREIGRRCAEETEKVSSYISERLIISRAWEFLKGKDYIAGEWEEEFVEPDRYHVTQIAREPDGSEPADRWTTIGPEHYDNVGFWTKLPGSAKADRMRVNHMMGPEQYLRALRTEQARSGHLYRYRDQPFYLLEYEISDKGYFPGLADEAELPVHTRLWIAVHSGLLAKVEAVIRTKDPAMKGIPIQLAQTFAGYGLTLRIEPPEPWMVLTSESR
jgi:hypothetical protein